MKIVISTQQKFLVDDDVCKKLILSKSPCITRVNAEVYYKGRKYPEFKKAKEEAIDIGDGVLKITDNYFFNGDDVCYFSYSDSSRSNEEFISLLDDDNIGRLKIIDIPLNVEFQITKGERGETVKEVIPFRSWK